MENNTVVAQIVVPPWWLEQVANDLRAMADDIRCIRERVEKQATQ